MPEDPVDTAPQAPALWVAYGNQDEDEDFLVGSPAGLRALRDHIDEALEHGVSHIHNPQIGLNGIRCRESQSAPPSAPAWTAFAGYGCLVVLVGILALALYGLYRLAW